MAAAAAAPPSGVVTTVAGQPGVAGYWDGPDTDALFTHPTWLDVAVSDRPPSFGEAEHGEIYVVDRINQLVRRISVRGVVSTLKLRRTFTEPASLHFGTAFGGGIAIEPPGAGCGGGIYDRGIFLAATGEERVYLVSTDGYFASRDWFPVIIGTGKTGARDGISPNEAEFRSPSGVAYTPNSRNNDRYELRQALYVADSGNHTIRRVAYSASPENCPEPLYVTTFAGAAGEPGSADGIGSAARFNTPRGIAATADGVVYVTDAGNHTVRKITPDGIVTTIAGTPGIAGSDDTHLNTPSGIDVNDKGEVFFVDTFNHAIRMIGTDGKLVTVAGQLGVSGFADGDAAAAKFNAPVGLKIAPDGSIVIADTGNNVIRRLTLK
jgi:hypothetical protein